ncbi:MAG: cupin domain-containing protein [Deltaproteobacteria bacterium]|nr:cupin domain-containing protein [Deltaproteobacteria bacterium]MBW2122619.1 cupin domain-containing protein [Deltaproteobacteria bacterium]
MEKELFAYAKDMKYVVHKTNGRHSTLIVTPQDMGAKNFIVGCHTMDPGGGAPEHTHENEQEAMFFYEGTGVATIDGVDYEILPDSVMLAPPGTRHSIRNTGKGPLKFVFVYCPPLPEHVSREEYFKRAKDRIQEA